MSTEFLKGTVIAYGTPQGTGTRGSATTLLLWADAHEADLSAARQLYDEANRDRA
jgi:hypothetical protein